jgi:hypothetical protein
MTPTQEGKMLAKIKHLHRRVYYAYLTPVEIVHLTDNHPVILEDESKKWYTYSLEAIKRGDCRPVWFYFTKKE